MNDRLGAFLGAAPLIVQTVENPDSDAVCVLLSLTNPGEPVPKDDRLAAMMDADTARAVAATLLVAAEWAERGIYGLDVAGRE